MRLWDYIRQHMLMNYDSTISENNATMTFEDVIIWAENYAKKLEGKDCIAIMCNSEMAAAMALLACFAGGVTAVPISMRYGESHYRKILEKLKPYWLITDIYGELMLINVEDGEYCNTGVSPAMIMFTSGTTGVPKGAMISEESLLGNIRDISSYFCITRDDTILITRPIYHCAVATGEYIVSLVKGVSIRFCSEGFNPVRWISLIEKYSITVMCGTPTMMNFIASVLHGKKLETIHCIAISGECLHKSDAIRIREAFDSAEIYHVYGLTEACPRVAYLPPHLFDKMPDSVGIPLKSNSIKIMKDDGMPAKPNEPGILWVKGNIMQGYYDDKEQTDKVLVDSWLITGDIATLDEKGYIRIKGRGDELIIKAGMNIYPQEIESSLKQSDKIIEAYIYPIVNNGITSLGLNVVGHVDSEEEVRKICAQYLCDYQLPLVINIVDEITKNGSGKIDRRSTGEGY